MIELSPCILWLRFARHARYKAVWIPDNEVAVAYRNSRDNALSFLLLVIAGKGGNWLITPMRHPDATTVDYVLTWVQIVVCLVAAIRLHRIARARSDSA